MNPQNLKINYILNFKNFSTTRPALDLISIRCGLYIGLMKIQYALVLKFTINFLAFSLYKFHKLLISYPRGPLTGTSRPKIPII